jgi:hypothetical protein
MGRFGSFSAMTDRFPWCAPACLLAAAAFSFLASTTARCDEGEAVLRVESEVFVDGEKEPVARSLTLFRNGLAWDFLEQPKASGKGESDLTEIVLHDPVRERAVVVDPKRNLKTQIDSLRLERLSASLSAWARKSDDRLVRWAGGPDFGDGFREEDSKLELVGPRVKYEVEFAAATSEDDAQRYRRFADTAMLLKALLHPGGIPPFPRLAINRRVASLGGIPATVTLEIDSKAAIVGARPQVLRSVHKIHPRLVAGDLERIEDAEAHIAIAEQVDLAAFMEEPAAAP